MRTDSVAFAQKNLERAKDPRYVIELAFDSANAVLWYFTSHTDAALPSTGVAGSILGILEGLSGTSQTLNPDTANATIGSISFSLVDRLSIVTTTLGSQLVLGRSTRKQRVRIYVGFQGLAWADYTLVQTQLVTEIAFSEGAYKFTCADIQREMRKDLFVLAKTTLALSVLAADTTINVVSTTGFSMVAHGTSYSDAPSVTVGYVRIEDEIVRYTGTTATSFTGCVRGALNTRAVDHLIDPTLTEDRRTVATEYVYLELPAIDLMYRLLTGKDRLGASAMPATWNLGIATSYVRLTDFTGIGKDLWNTVDDQQGFVVRFEDLAKTDGKKFIETELALLCGVFQPIYADGATGCKRMANILAGAAYTGMLDETNVVSYGDLVHDFGSMHNVFEISWNWEPLQKAFTRVNVLVDAASIAVYGRADPLKLKFRGLHGSRHSSVILAQRFDGMRDRFTGPPLRLEVSALPSLNTAEVGDVKRVRVANVRDFTAPGGGGPLDRSFEIQNIQVDWITGALSTKLFASSAAPGTLAPTSDATVLTAGWYTGTGTALSSVLTITGSGPGHVSASGSLAGNASLASAIFYYVGDLQIDADVLINWPHNVWLRVNGFLQINGRLSAKGAGFPGAAQVPPLSIPNPAGFITNKGTQGFIGSTEAGGGVYFPTTIQAASIRGDVVNGQNPTMPQLHLLWDGVNLTGVPDDLRGSSGSSGMWLNTGNPLSGDSRQVGGIGLRGGAGGAGGGGLCITCKGLAFGVSGQIDLSGADGSPGDINIQPNFTAFAGSGGGGAPGGLLIILDGAGATATGLTDSGFVALNGKTPIVAQPLIDQSTTFLFSVEGQKMYSYFVGSGDGTTFPLPSLSNARGGSRVQYVPGNPGATADPSAPDFETFMQELQASNWTERANPKNFDLRAAAWFVDKFVAVGAADGTDAYIVTSPDGLSWTERANPKNFRLDGIACSLTVAVAVGVADGTDAYLISSTDGLSWTERANPKNVGLTAVTWAPQLGLFVAVGLTDGGDSYIVTSPDGTTWTERANPKATGLWSVAWSGTTFAAVGNWDAVTDAYIVTSPDGVTWTEQSNPIHSNADGDMVWFRDKFVVCGQSAGGLGGVLIATSPDGVTWTIRPNPRNVLLNAMVATQHLVLASGGFGTTPYTITSRDGITWTERENLSTSVFMLGGAWSGHRFVIVGSADGTKARLVTSLAR